MVRKVRSTPTEPHPTLLFFFFERLQGRQVGFCTLPLPLKGMWGGRKVSALSSTLINEGGDLSR